MISAEVYLWGTRIGVVSQESITDIPVFSYDDNFLQSKIEVAPLTMPLSKERYSFPNLVNESFHSLPGLLADSLPDKFGNKLLERYLADHGRDLDDISPVERLLYVGNRGMGALEFRPQQNYTEIKDDSIDLDALVGLASDILSNKESLHFSADKITMEQMINVGTSAGGARAKAIIVWNKNTNDIRSGQINAGDGYEYYIIKFDGVKNNKDKDKKSDGKAYTRIEYAYHLMAKAANIEMSDCSLLCENDHYHFMTKRFDRDDNGVKIHMQTLGALAHFDFNSPGINSYEQVSQVMQKLNLQQSEIEQLYRRMIFNIIAQNKDDHVKNISFLMNKHGVWSLSPAYDITYANNPNNRWTSHHQLTMNGKNDNFTIDDFYESARKMNIPKNRANKIIQDVIGAAGNWSTFANNALVPELETSLIEEKLQEYITMFNKEQIFI